MARTNYADKNAAVVLEQVKAYIQMLQEHQQLGHDYKAPEGSLVRFIHRGYDSHAGWTIKISSVCNDLSIFDWWNDTLSVSQLKQMKKFLEQAIELGFTGYVCFKVGAAGCSHGMWAHTEETTDGYSPKTGNVLYHSFVSGENYWDMAIDNVWMHDRYPDHDYKWTLAEIKSELAKVQQPEEEIDESTEIAQSAMSEFKVYFKDGNQKIFVVAGMMELIRYLARVNHNNKLGEIAKIEEV